MEVICFGHDGEKRFKYTDHLKKKSLTPTSNRYICLIRIGQLLKFHLGIGQFVVSKFKNFYDLEFKRALHLTEKIQIAIVRALSLSDVNGINEIRV